MPLILLAYSMRDKTAAIPVPVIVDGPYVFYRGENILVRTIVEGDGRKSVQTDTFSVRHKSALTLQVSSGTSGLFFPVALKQKLGTERAEYKKVSRQLAVSDIEGNLPALLTLLRANGVIDADFNWTWGNGHLVLAGDFFDRGTQVTELLWFIYALEAKAREVGGYVHFILGNHEVMNLTGDFRYVHPRYMEHAALMQQKYYHLFDDKTELGRWLRTKNVVEKVGDVLYTHGGIAQELNVLDMPVAQLNEVVRPWLGDTTYRYTSYQAELLFSEIGPFWYRGYYTGPRRATINQLDSTLYQTGTRYITTGHTITADTISTWFNGKLFNTDVPHYKGKSEALLIENGVFYRVDQQGRRIKIAG